MRIHDIAKDYECLREDLQFNSSRVSCLAWHPSSKMLLSGDNGKTIVVTHLEKLLKPTIAAGMTDGPIGCLVFLNEDWEEMENADA